MDIEISEKDPNLKNVLWNGVVETKNGNLPVILNRSFQVDEKKFIFSVIKKEEVSLLKKLQRLLISIRAISLTATATPGIVAAMIGTQMERERLNWSGFIFSLISVVLLQIAVNVLNDVYDHVRAVDLPGDIGGSGVIQKGWFSARFLSFFSYGMLLLAVACAVPALISYPKELGIIAIIALIGAMGYSGPWLGFKYQAKGDGVVFLLCGPLLSIGFAVVSFGHVSVAHVVSGIVFGLAAVGILHANNLNDIDVDQSRGARTIANQLGFKRSKKYLFLIYAAIALLLISSALLFHLKLIFILGPFLAALPVMLMLKKVRSASGPLSPEISSIRFNAAQIHLLMGIGWILVLGLGF